jgi:menaquinol-cytochrome c reductase iron-sulfur subunit
MAETSSDRRRFLSVCATALIALIGGMILTPVLAFVTSPLRGKARKVAAGSEFSDAGGMDSIPVGKWTLCSIEIIRQDGWVKTRQSRSVWVFIKTPAPKDIRVLSPICTHLGCPIGLNAAASQFICPCHGGIFGLDGARVGGPPPRGMDRLDFEVREDHLWVRWQDFRISVTDRVAVQV